jgi:hypothetical protein
VTAPSRKAPYYVAIVDDQGNIIGKSDSPLTAILAGVDVENGRLKVDASLHVDNVTVDNVGITSVDGATMESNGEYMPVKLTGSKQEVVNVFSRSLRTSSQNTTIFRPAGAKGCIIYLTVYGITGSFTSGQGVRLRAQLQGVKGFSFGDIYTEIQTTSNRSQIIMMYPGASDDNVPAASGGSRVITSIYAPPRISLSIVISGTFGGGEGIDCEADIEWLYG